MTMSRPLKPSAGATPRSRAHEAKRPSQGPSPSPASRSLHPSRAPRPARAPAPQSALSADRLFKGFVAAIAAAVGLSVWLRAAPPAAPAMAALAQSAPNVPGNPTAMAAATLPIVEELPAPSDVCAKSQDDAHARGDSPLITASAAQITLHPPGDPMRASAAPAPLALSTMQPEQAAFRFINMQRERVGLPAMGWQSNIADAAREHARYNARNGLPGHDEQAGAPFFSGATSADRITAAWPTRFSAEIVASIHGQFARPQDAIEGLFDAPFHRAHVLSDALCAGAGSARDFGAAGEQTSVVVDFGGRHRAFRDSELIAYPYAGQPDAKTSWRAIETPNPFAGAAGRPDLIGRVVGYPITLNSAPDAWVSVGQFTLIDASGTVVPCFKADLSTNAADPDVAACIPLRPLKPYTTYTATANGVLTSGTQVARDFHVSWSFATGPASAQDGLADTLPPEQSPAFEGP